MRQPLNLTEAEALSPGITPVYADASERMVDVEMPGGEIVAIDDLKLRTRMREEVRESHQLTLLESDRAMTDCRPISILSVQTIERLSKGLGFDLDKRRFRANVYIDLESGNGFNEDMFVGRTLRIGGNASVAVTDRDARCKMITLDPETGEAEPAIMKHVARSHDGRVGVYGAVLITGIIRPGDEIYLV
jgi:hypothetical protein